MSQREIGSTRISGGAFVHHKHLIANAGCQGVNVPDGQVCNFHEPE